jgi:hypothetical protein
MLHMLSAKVLGMPVAVRAAIGTEAISSDEYRGIGLENRGGRSKPESEEDWPRLVGFTSIKTLLVRILDWKGWETGVVM